MHSTYYRAPFAKMMHGDPISRRQMKDISPEILADFDDRVPYAPSVHSLSNMVRRLTKYNKEIKPLPAAYKAALEAVGNHLLDLWCGTEIQKEDEVWAHLNHTTSPGPILRKYGNNKKQVWENPAFRTFSQEWDSNLMTNRCVLPFACSSKDEPLPTALKSNGIKKNEQPRLYMAADFKSTLVQNEYEGLQNIRFHDAAMNEVHGWLCPSVLGRSLGGGLSDWMARNLIRNPNLLWGDLDACDSRFQAKEMWWLFEVRATALKLTGYHRLRYACLAGEIIDSVAFMGDGSVWRVFGGNKSGHSSTIEMTTIHAITTVLAMALTIFQVPPRLAHVLKAENMLKNHSFRVHLGDDFIFAMSPFLAERITLDSAREAMEKNGTPVDWCDAILPLVLYDDVSLEPTEFTSKNFCFVAEHSSYAMVPKRDRVLSSILVKGDGDPRNHYSKLVSLLYDAYWLTDMRNLLRALIERTYKEYGTVCALEPPPRDDKIVAFWLGWETL